MDTSPDSPANAHPAAAEVRADSTPATDNSADTRPPSPRTNESRPPEESAESPNREVSEQSPAIPQSPPPAPPSLPAIEISRLREHAYWTEFEEDTTTPDEEELKEIENTDADYSARDRRLQPV